jgi:NADH-quinone oxidoreductase subunit B
MAVGIFENNLPEYVVFTKLDQAINWARKSAISYMTLDLHCCGVEIAQVAAGRYDIERFGAVPICAPSHADLMIVAGAITYKIAEHIRALYDEMPKSKYVMSLGSCSNTGGLYSWENSYSVVSGVDKILPVDVYVPGCPPRPEAILHGLITLQKKISRQHVLVKSSGAGSII